MTAPSYHRPGPLAFGIGRRLAFVAAVAALLWTAVFWAVSA